MLKSIIYIICKKRQILSCCRGYVICCQDMLSVLCCRGYIILENSILQIYVTYQLFHKVRKIRFLLNMQ